MLRIPHDWLRQLGLFAAGGLLTAGTVTAGFAFAEHRWRAVQFAALWIAALVAGLTTLVLVRTFWRFVLIIIVVRVSLDVFNDQFGLIDPAALVGMIFIGSSIVGLLSLSLAGKLRPASATVKWLYCLVAWSAFSAALSDLPVEAMVATTKLLAGVLLLGVLEQILPGHPERVRQLLIAVLVSSIIPIGLALKQGITGAGDTDTPGFDRVYGTSVHPVSLATYLMIILVVAVGLLAIRRHVPLLLAVILAAGVSLYWTYTRSAWLIIAVTLILLLVRVRPVLVAPVLITLVAIPFFRPDVAARFADLSQHQAIGTDDAANSLLWRFDYWTQIIGLSAHQRLTGVGLDTVVYRTRLGLPPHNIFVQAYVELGIVGCAIMTAAFLALALQLRRRRREADSRLAKTTAAIAAAAALSMFLQALVTNPLAGTVTWWYFAAAAAWGYAAVRPEANDDPPAAYSTSGAPGTRAPTTARPARTPEAVSQRPAS